jgi:hypothetical protein
MSYKPLLTEYFELCPNGYCEDLLTESEKRLVKEQDQMYLTGKIQCADALNGNGRIYPRSILEREVNSYKRLVEDRRALGELNHPDKSEIDLGRVCHIVKEVWWNGNDVMGKLQVLNTPTGQILKELVKAGVKIGISSRGTGSVREGKEGTIVEDDFQLICFDIVSEPSTKGAFMMQESKKSLIEERETKINNLINNILKKGNK